MAVLESTQPLTIRVHPRDNVAIVVNAGGLPAGTRFDHGLVLREDVPEGHKVALTEMAANDEIIRYGEIIGYALQPIAPGSWVHEGLVRLPEMPALDRVPMATAVPAPLPPLEGFTFLGYRNPDGTVGTKNILGISTTV